jgi:arginase
VRLDRRLDLLGVPSSAGARRTGQERAPAALREAGLVDRMRSKGLDPEHPREQNLRAVAEVARRTAERVAEALSRGRWPLVLGGDCTLSLGVIAELVRHRPRLGLLYFDGDVDLNTPETTRSGIFDGMVMAHLLGRGAPALAGLGPRKPLLSDEDVVLFGYDPDSGWIDPAEMEALGRSRLVKYPLARVREDAVAAAKEALLRLENRSEAFVVHFDVDVMNIAAADLHHPRGLDPDATFAALRIFLGAPRCAGLVVTELNVESDRDGACAALLVEGLVGALDGRKEAA